MPTLEDGLLLLDGATGTELDRRGVDTSLPLWSARAIIQAPGVLSAVHADYLAAGADAITANTFRTHRRTLAKAGHGERARAITEAAVQIARAARDRVRPDALVLGSVAPLEDCYEPALAPDERACRREHGELVDALIGAGVDALLIETMNTVREARAAVVEAAVRAPGRVLLSLCMRSDGPPGVLLSGEPVAELLESLERDAPGGLGACRAIGVNCVAAPAVEGCVRELRARLPASVRVGAYANVGHPDPARGWVNTDAVAPERYAAFAQRWADAGATLIGGCCGTTPSTIAALRAAFARPGGAPLS